MRMIDLGAGSSSPDGYEPWGHGHGSEIYPLPLPDESVDVIRASHCLEHFPHGQVVEVLKDWTRALKKGGRLRVAVPDFEKIAQKYLEGKQQPTEAYVMGGQVDKDDYHKAMFDAQRLRKALSDAGLALIRPWQSEIVNDCAALDISLNLEGMKPHCPPPRVCAAMSIPRLGFMDNMMCAYQSLIPLSVKLRLQGGVFWGQALTRCLEKIIEEDNPDWILTLDYDTAMTIEMVAQLIQLTMVYPEVDALAPLQASRHQNYTMFLVEDQDVLSKDTEDGKKVNRINLAGFRNDIKKVQTAHFGLTMLRVSKLKELPRPWFLSTPDKNGRWEIEDGKVDEDEYFWRNWAAAGNSLYLASRLSIGHMELMVRWPGKDLKVVHQSIRDFKDTGLPPKDAW